MARGRTLAPMVLACSPCLPRRALALTVVLGSCSPGDGGTGDASASSGAGTVATGSPTSSPTTGASSPTDPGTTSTTTSSGTSTTGESSGFSGTIDPSGTSGATTAVSGPTPDFGGQCLAATEPCDDPSDCCPDQGLTCDNTTLGMVCCGLDGTPCVTPNGEDCCGDRLCVAGTCLSPGATPPFRAPYPCGQSWTYSHHNAEVRRALDFVDNGGNTNGAPVLAALAGVATRHYQEGGAGNYIVIDHGGGWTTYYFHLQAFSVDDGTYVQQGQEVGLVGSTGASSGPHIHFEELFFGEGKDIWLDGQALTPYPGTYGQKSHVSQNCP